MLGPTHNHARKRIHNSARRADTISAQDKFLSAKARLNRPSQLESDNITSIILKCCSTNNRHTHIRVQTIRDDNNAIVTALSRHMWCFALDATRHLQSQRRRATTYPKHDICYTRTLFVWGIAHSHLARYSRSVQFIVLLAWPDRQWLSTLNTGTQHTKTKRTTI